MSDSAGSIKDLKFRYRGKQALVPLVLLILLQNVLARAWINILVFAIVVVTFCLYIDFLDYGNIAGLTKF